MSSQEQLQRGLYRIKNPSGEDDVQVADVNGGSELPIPESLYRARGYHPLVETLPEREEYFAKR